MGAETYWAQRYAEAISISHHATQNYRIARDFYLNCHERDEFKQALKSRKIVEVGCGTGDLANMVKACYGTPWYCATDLSALAADITRRRYSDLDVRKFDILNDEPFAAADLVISSNTVEHFTDPHAVIRKMFVIAPKVLLLVPFEQPVHDSYEVEGGAGHAFSFNKETFDRYTVLDEVVFETAGWQHGAGDGENPRQLAIVFGA